MRLAKFTLHAIGGACALYACAELIRWIFYYSSNYGELLLSPYPLSHYWWELIVLVCGMIWVLAMAVIMLNVMFPGKKQQQYPLKDEELGKPSYDQDLL